MLDAEFSALYKKYKNPIFAYIFYLAGDRPAAEEICQDVFLKVYLNIAKFENRSSFKTWIYKIARNAYLDYAQAQKRKVTIDNIEFFVKELEDRGMSPEEHAINMATKELIENTLNKLSQKYRMLLILRDIQNLSYKEISDIAEMELNSVKVGIFRARREFQKIYEEMEEL
ncbi:RNA polymerase sigma factor, sigma-70 family [Desulfosporosinus orientis DSM 765]|uniref:RNA polymerase sigma factor, sigma-70 family n=1 Tax=Desulfosporosinus orientis (strain ATCC 19365 / DSM 765 / NCIMB 8382 / VKM B-1628 / Singapore I) TaxID=768706 RepID=G7W932_DESOD|nr:RNA polymerase sigma factor [Desulfosporosinus orientis]AET68241.1 RNA polymerase sigma factor, sigma-70 family [Desulfosporosinus orientis DSM 765]